MKYDLNNINDNYGDKIEKEYLNGSHASELALKYLGKEEVESGKPNVRRSKRLFPRQRGNYL